MTDKEDKIGLWECGEVGGGERERLQLNRISEHSQVDFSVHCKEVLWNPIVRFGFNKEMYVTFFRRESVIHRERHLSIMGAETSSWVFSWWQVLTKWRGLKQVGDYLTTKPVTMRFWPGSVIADMGRKGRIRRFCYYVFTWKGNPTCIWQANMCLSCPSQSWLVIGSIWRCFL